MLNTPHLDNVPSHLIKQWRSHWGGKGDTPDSEKFAKNRGKSGKKEEKSGRKSKNREVSFTLPLLTDRAGYATAIRSCTPS